MTVARRTSPVCLLVVGLLAAHVVTAPLGGAASPSEGALDPGWSGDGVAFGNSAAAAYGIALQSDGKPVIVTYPSGGGMAVMRFTKNGQLDTTFGDAGTARVPDTAYPAYADPASAGASGIAVDSLDRIIIAGNVNVSIGAEPNNNSDIAVARFTPSGVMDDTFGNAGLTVDDLYAADEYVAGLVVQPNNRVVVAGDVFEGLTDDSFAVRYLANGARDAGFTGGGGDGYFTTTGVTAFDAYLDSPSGIGLGPNGTVVLVGAGLDGTEYTTIVIRLTSAGDFDDTFGNAGAKLLDSAGGFERAYTVVTDGKGRLVVVGTREPTDGADFRAAVFRFLADGTLDDGFGSHGLASVGQSGADVSTESVALQRDGKIVVAGTTTISSVGSGTTLRLTGAGNLDPTFSGDGKQSLTLSDSSRNTGVTIQRNGRILDVGVLDAPTQLPYVAALVGDATPPGKALIKGVHQWLLAKATLTWHATDDNTGVQSYTVQRRAATYTKAKYGQWSTWKSGTATTATFAGKPGHTYCFRARARDFAGNLGAYPAARCTAKPLDERKLAQHGAWSPGSSADYYRGTALTATAKGASLTLDGARWRHLAAVVTTCPSCGTLDVYLGTTLLRTLDLSAASHHRKVMKVAGRAKAQSGTIRLVVRSAGHPVTVEGLGISLA